MQSAFIDIGLERAAFLHVADVWHPPEGETISMARSSAPLTPIEKQVFDGQSLVVQVIKDPIGTKGARLSTQISIAGRMLVFLPQDDHIGVSQKIPTAQREALRQHLQTLVGVEEVALFCAPMGKMRPSRNLPMTWPICARPGNAFVRPPPVYIRLCCIRT